MAHRFSCNLRQWLCQRASGDNTRTRSCLSGSPTTTTLYGVVRIAQEEIFYSKGTWKQHVQVDPSNLQLTGR